MSKFKKWDAKNSPVCSELRNEYNDLVEIHDKIGVELGRLTNASLEYVDRQRSVLKNIVEIYFDGEKKHIETKDWACKTCGMTFQTFSEWEIHDANEHGTDGDE